jgi:hypothetical protein
MISIIIGIILVIVIITIIIINSSNNPSPSSSSGSSGSSDIEDALAAAGIPTKEQFLETTTGEPTTAAPTTARTVGPTKADFEEIFSLYLPQLYCLLELFFSEEGITNNGKTMQLVENVNGIVAFHLTKVGEDTKIVRLQNKYGFYEGFVFPAILVAFSKNNYKHWQLVLIGMVATLYRQSNKAFAELIYDENDIITDYVIYINEEGITNNDDTWKTDYIELDMLSPGSRKKFKYSSRHQYDVLNTTVGKAYFTKRIENEGDWILTHPCVIGK